MVNFFPVAWNMPTPMFFKIFKYQIMTNIFIDKSIKHKIINFEEFAHIRPYF